MREGYKKTEVGVIPKDWEVKKLEEVCEILDGKRKPIKAFDREQMKGNIPYYGASGIIDWVNDYIFDEEIILLGEDGENLKSRNVPLAFKVTGKSWVNNHAHVLKPIKENIDFLTEVLESKDYTSFVLGSAQPKLTQAQCRKILIQIPPLKEQEKIAEILSTIDSQIDDTEKLIEKSKDLKKGLMQKLLTKGIGHSEFKKTEVGEIPASWEVKKLEEIAKICYGKSQKEVECENGQFKILGTGGVMGYTNSFLWDKPSVLIGRKGTIDKPQYIDEPFWTVDTLFYTQINNKNLPKWFYYYMNNIDLKKYNEATGVPSLSVANLNTIKIITPPLKDQEKIAEILSSVDSEIEKYENKKQKLEELKKGLMQQLLTGKIRTV